MKRFITNSVLAAFAVGMLCTTIYAAEPATIPGFSEAAKEMTDLTIPEGTRIVALGEAAHGNKEFQELKLSVFQHLVETTNVRALILEGDFGGCAIANDYIQGGSGTAEEVTKLLGYRIYRTDEMCALIEWMHDYNETADESDRVRLYGADIQNDQSAIQVLETFYETVDPEKSEVYSTRFTELFGSEEDAYDPDSYDEIMTFLSDLEADFAANAATYETQSDSDSCRVAERAVYALQCYMNLMEKEQNYSKYRDTKMAENVDWALAIEEERSGALMLSGHNGHITKSKSSNYTYLGTILKEEYSGAYFALGTDFYISNDNLPVNGKREVITLCSDDPLAYQLKALEKDSCYLDFSKIDPKSELGQVIHTKMSTGSLGEQYNAMFKIMKNSYQINYPPADLYDGMILFYETTPIEIWE